MPPPQQRQSSTSGMDTLADLASMQHHQQTARANALSLRSTEAYEPQAPPAAVRPSLQAIARSHSGSKSSLDITMTDAPAQTPPPRAYTAPSLSSKDLEEVSQLVAYLAENSNAYESHVQLIKALHRGFLKHIDPSDIGIAENRPETYELLGDLRQAMDAMASRFSLGEDLWTARLQAQQATATSLEDCLGVVELYEKAVSEEMGSARIWSAYGEWMLSLYNASTPADQAIGQLSIPLGSSVKLSEEDKAVASEVFAKPQMIEVWRRGTEDTKYRIDKSHLTWNNYTELLLADLNAAPTAEAIEAMRSHLTDRLKTPHATWDTSFQKFSTFITTFDNSSYEDTMVAVNQQASAAKARYSDREIFETKLQRAMEADDRAAEWTILKEYLEWEHMKDRKRRKYPIFELINALHQRSLLRFPSDVELWEDYASFLGDSSIQGQRTVTILSALGRACDHCPWSGTLWAQYIASAELENLPFADIGQIKHKATSTGLLDVSGMEEIIKIHTAWCGFLRRQAFQHDSTDEELDVAEVGILSAIEDTENLGENKFGKDYQGDPQYRLERIYIKFLVQCRNYAGARDRWKKLVKRHGNSYEFWLRYYVWEMHIWGLLLNSGDAAMPRQTPTEATSVLQDAIKRTNMDWPEKIIDTYLIHCQDHGDAADLQTAMIESRKASKSVAKRRETEAIEQAELERQRVAQMATYNDTTSKRKRDDQDVGDDAAASKRTRAEDDDETANTLKASLLADSALKRDRENATVIVKNLPSNATDRRVRHFFSDCGTINTLKVASEQDGLTSTATIEFGTRDDVLTALTRDGKSFEGNTVEVQVGSGSTIYVTNFPPTADEAYIRSLFAMYGEITDIRFPSLKFGTHRRFCYVQFKLANQAYAATKLDGQTVEDDLKLVAKISDPAHKQQRHGAIQEGRELYAANVDWSATEDELKEIFSKYGTIEKVRLPRQVNGKSKGMAFIVYSKKEEASAGLALNNTKFKARILQVETSTANPSKRHATTIVARTSASPHPEGNGDAASPTSDTSAPARPRPSREEITSRTIALLNVPDTVNDARIKALAEPYGALVKIVLRPDHQGAIIEFQDAAAAGRAALGLDGREIVPGRILGVGTVKEMLAQKAEHKRDKIEPVGPGRKIKGVVNEQAKALLMRGPIRRPGQQGGRRGGLGLKRGGGGLGAGEGAKVVKEESNGTAAANGEGKKSNADFKALFER